MERSKPPLHNFRMEGLKWGNQRLLNCRKENPNGENSDLDDHHRKSSSPPPSTGHHHHHHHHGFIGQFERRCGSSSSDRKREIDNGFKVWQMASSSRKLRIGDEGIEAFREKLMDDLHMKADKIKDAILREGLVENEEEAERPPSPPPPKPAKSPSLPPPVSDTDGAARPWNLRTRRAACKAPMNGGDVAGRSPLNVDVSLTMPNNNNNNLSPSRNGSGSKSPKSRAAVSGEKREREKFSIQLNRSEIEADFMAIAGLRLPRRPRKRPRAVQKILEKLTPGFWLTEVNADMYKVEDLETGKR